MPSGYDALVRAPRHKIQRPEITSFPPGGPADRLPATASHASRVSAGPVPRLDPGGVFLRFAAEQTDSRATRRKSRRDRETERRDAESRSGGEDM